MYPMNIAFTMVVTAFPVLLAFILLTRCPKNKFHIPIIFSLFTILILGILTALSMTATLAACNIQDIIPLCAVLLFGPVIGLGTVITSSIIYCLISPAFEDLTPYIAIISLFLSATLGILLRRHIFNAKTPYWWHGLFLGNFTATFHLLILLWVYIDYLQIAYDFIATYAVPMMGISAVCTMLVFLFVPRSKKDNPFSFAHKKLLARQFQKWLLACMIIGFAITCLYSFVAQTRFSQDGTRIELRTDLDGVREDILAQTKIDLINIAKLTQKRVMPTADIPESERVAYYQQQLDFLLTTYNLTEANIITKQGIIIASTHPDFIGYNMYNGVQSAQLMAQIKERGYAAQDLLPTASDASMERQYVVLSLDNGDLLQVGYSREEYEKRFASIIKSFSSNIHVGKTGHVLITNADQVVISDYTPEYEKKKLAADDSATNFTDNPENTIFTSTIHGEYCFCMYETLKGYHLLAYIPYKEVMAARNMAVYMTILMQIFLFTSIYFIIYFLIKKLVVDNMFHINEALNKITKGNLDIKIQIHSSAEFESLSQDINTTVTTLKQYIADANARIDQELEYARIIQTSALPTRFPPWPDLKAFDIYAESYPAKEVGGDFYDFFLLKEKLVFIIADVSGKGIPAALFMMKAKAQIKSRLELGGSLTESFKQINQSLCENNETNMFVTVFAGILDYHTGELQYINAGHNKPLIGHNGCYHWLEGRSGMPLAALEKAHYKLFTTQIQHGDIIYVYTDGITEAENESSAFYGNKRLFQILNSSPIIQEQNLCNLMSFIVADVKKFSGSAEQADDITMLAVKLN
jgi:serine phosphatase RsbU (regulator of sigma subunit)